MTSRGGAGVSRAQSITFNTKATKIKKDTKVLLYKGVFVPFVPSSFFVLFVVVG